MFCLVTATKGSSPVDVWVKPPIGGTPNVGADAAFRVSARGSEEWIMIFDYSLAALVTAALLVYLTYALLRPERL
jgi:K+-transporting ATPase ATPase F chain